MAVFGTCPKPFTFFVPSLKSTPWSTKDFRPIFSCRGDRLRFRTICKHKEDKQAGLSSSRAHVPRATVDCDSVAEEIIRPPARADSRSMWNEALFSPDDQVENCAKEADRLKECVRRMVVDKETKPEDKMILIDTLERLGVAYHFEQEIGEQIAHIFQLQERKDEDYDLYTTSLHFRLFRLHGYNVPCSVFNKFKDEDGTFKKALMKDIKGLLSLYEASQLRCRQEDILKEAKVFATHFLKYAMPIADPCLQERVERALSRNRHWSLSRLEARHYIPIYEKEESKNELLLKFAKLDFNLLQNPFHCYRWWKDLGIGSKLPYLRDCVVECYMWTASVNLESRHSFPRLCAAKGLLLIVVMNDTFDSYATLEEAKKFAEIRRRSTLPRWTTD